MNGKNIIVIEDSLTDAELIKAVFRRTDWHIIIAQDGNEAQRLMNRHDFRVAFVDLNLPGMSGVYLVRWIKEHFPHVPVVIVSGYTEERDKVSLADCGAVFLFPKPFTTVELQYILNFMDVADALWKRGKKLRPSWITSVAGIATIGFGFWQMHVHPEPAAAAIIAAGLGLVGAQDSGPLKKLFEMAKPKEK